MMRNPTTQGIVALLLGIAIFSVQDLILKQLSGDYPLHQAMVIRSLVALPFHLAIVRWFDGTLATIATPGWWKMLARGGLNFVAYACYYLGLAALPMATTVALFFTAPLFITLGAAVFLREQVSLASMLSIATGFLGVLLIVQPGSLGLGWSALLPIAGAAGYALSMVIARPLGRTESAAAMAFWGNVCFLFCALALSAVFGTGLYGGSADPALAFLTRGWIVPSAGDLALMTACGVIAATGLTLLTHAYRIAPSSAVAPFEYSFMFWGVLWGWLIWGEFPGALSWAGIAVIIGAGLYLIRTGQGQPPTPAPASAATLVAAAKDSPGGPIPHAAKGKAAPEGTA